MPYIEIAGRRVGSGHPCFVVAEVGVNHNGDVRMAGELVEAASKAGADAVKFQTFDPSEIAAPGAPKASYQRAGSDDSDDQVAMLERLALSPDEFRELHDISAECDVVFLSTAFDPASADFLVDLGIPALKVASGELTNLPLVVHVASLGKPIILSTGMATIEEIDAAVAAMTEQDRRVRYALLHCVSSYPSQPSEMNLLAMRTMAERYQVPIGLSDHTLGTDIALASVALGATIVEKHLTLDRRMPGPDHASSLEPSEFQTLVSGIRSIEAAMGDGLKQPTEGELAIAAAARRSLVTSRDISQGEALHREDIVQTRPGTGLPPSALESVIGRRARVGIPAGVVITEDLLS